MNVSLFPLAGVPEPSPVPPNAAAGDRSSASPSASNANFAVLLGLALLPSSKLPPATSAAAEGAGSMDNATTAAEGSDAGAAEGAAIAPGEDEVAGAGSWMDATGIGLAVGRALARSSESAASSEAPRPSETGPAPAAARAIPAEGEPEENRVEGVEVSASAESSPAPEGISRVERSVDRLDPTFGARLERVIERMREEWGHEVRVVETHRSQARQDALWAQGRTRPGPVVTWTRSSNHTQGRAADLLIDGRYDNAAGYARLARIAAEEGLRTLGARDPGHIELPGRGAETFETRGTTARSVATGEAARPAGGAPPASAPPAAGIARVARVAEVARVAQVATVAQVAQVAAPGVSRPSGAIQPRSFSSHVSAPLPSEAVRVVDAASKPVESSSASSAQLSHAAPAASAEGGRNGEGARDGARRERDKPIAAEPRIERSGPESARPEIATHTAARAETPETRTPVANVVRSDAAERIGRIQEIQQNASPRTLSHVTLEVDAPEGGHDRIRIDLRGTSVETSIELQDPVKAERLRARVGELHGAFERQGLEADAVRIRSTVTADGLASLGTLADVDVRAAGAAKNQSDSTPHRDRGGANEREESPRDSSRHRSRQEQQEGKRK